jgi:Ulp1 family protease
LKKVHDTAVWKFEVLQSCPQQKGGDDCGVFVLQYARQVAESKRPKPICPVLQMNIADVRKHMVQEIVASKLKPFATTLISF